MPRNLIPLPEWKPDNLEPSTDTLNTADNVYPSMGVYRPVGSFLANGPALPSLPLGAAAFRSQKGVPTILAGTATDLYKLTGRTWTSLATGFNATRSWQFARFGERIVAANGADPTQFYTLDGPAGFAPLANAPRMGLLTVVRDFLFGGIINGAQTWVQWSGINNSEQWLPGYNQSDYNIAASGGAVTAIAGGEYGLVFQEQRIVRATYVAGNVIFQFDEISPNIGCIEPRSFCQLGRMTFFLSQRGFMMCDGYNVKPIGDERVDRTFLNSLDASNFSRMSCVADPVNKLVYWSLPAAAPTMWFVYSWTMDRWTRVVAPASLLFQGLAPPASLDITIGSPDTAMDAGLPFDDPSYSGGQSSLFLFDGTYTLGTMSGPNLAAQFDFGPFSLAGSGRAASIRRVRPITDATSGLTLTLDCRHRIGDAANVSTHTGPTSAGDIVARRRARTVDAGLNIAAGTPWTFIQGLDFEFDGAGAR